MDDAIGKRIRKIREDRGLTREALAEQVDVSAKFLYEIETGRKGFSANTLLNLSQALDESCDFIMTGYEWSDPDCIYAELDGFDERDKEYLLDILKLVKKMCG